MAKGTNLTLNVTRVQADWLINTLMFYEEQSKAMLEDTKDPILLSTMNKMLNEFYKETAPIKNDLFNFIVSQSESSK